MSRRLAIVVLALLLASCASADDAQVDVGFLQDMIDHHDQAVRMALLVLDDDDVSPITRAFASDVVASQRYEIGLMEMNLLVRGETKGAPGREVMAWMDMPVPYAEMPGLVTQPELDELAAATGEDADALFFRLMTLHHVGGIHMATYAMREANDELVRNVADRIALSQEREIAEMAKAQEQLGIS